MKRILKITGIIVGCLLLVAVAAGAWFATRPPKPAKIFDPLPAGQRITDDGL